ncbi:hypothetical protein LNL84_10060 [Vibrio sp. ZSDZ34]|jgi:hypothetical protein|uniref:Outer membrane protein beta-barrel domain-containing protein n=1 Tax=Vibrio gelatinilyticus TaxID=2893468 RepID=A0A9X2AYW7_9VIBR|nr:hypothetical protein [Vibrio gelatinilyticus]MCJ2377172.1 hypothetical protein [Vibrio gelatinilyticus]
MLGKATRRALLCIAVIAPVVVQANNFNYNSFQVRLGADPGTTGAEFSTYFTQNTHFIVKADSRFEGDWDIAGGLGFNGPINQFADTYGQLLIHNVKYKGDEGLDTSFLSEFNIGTRVWLMQQVEVVGQIGMLNGNDKTRFIWDIGARFHSTDQLSLGVDVKDGGIYGTQAVMSVRFGF